MCHAAAVSTMLRHGHGLENLNESQIWDSIEFFQDLYDASYCDWTVRDENVAKVFARAESLARGEILPANPPLLFI